jgi:hypothetical protein
MQKSNQFIVVALLVSVVVPAIEVEMLSGVPTGKK